MESKIVKLREAKSGMVVARVWGRGGDREMFVGSTVSVTQEG